MMNISTSFFGLPLKNPVIASSSGITDNIDYIKELEQKGVAAIVLKSLFEEEIIHSNKQNLNRMNVSGAVYPETLSFLDYDDMDDPMSNYLKLISDAKKEVNIPIIASINCVTSDKWTAYAKQLEDAGADALELNLFILPSNLESIGQKTEVMYFDIINNVVKNVDIPVSIKMGYYSCNLGSFIQKLSKTGVAGITLFNRAYSPDFDIETFELISSHVLSTPAEKALPLRWISLLNGRVECNLAASTGVHTGEDLIKMILAGANAVQIASTLYVNGFGQIPKMISDLDSWMEKHNIANLEEFRGKMSVDTKSNLADYERVQFIKHFRHYSM